MLWIRFLCQKPFSTGKSGQTGTVYLPRMVIAGLCAHVRIAQLRRFLCFRLYILITAKTNETREFSVSTFTPHTSEYLFRKYRIHRNEFTGDVSSLFSCQPRAKSI